MSATQPTIEDPLAAGLRPILLTIVRTIGSSVLIFLAYYLLPVQTEDGRSDVPFLVLHVAVFVLIVVIQVPVIMRSRHPGMRAIEAAVLTILVFLTLFARLYLSADAGEHHVFNEVLNRNRALYFTVTVFSTVGFGDIVPRTEAVQMLVTTQMLLNLVVLGVVIKVLFTAGTRGMERVRTGKPPRPLPRPRINRRSR